MVTFNKAVQLSSWLVANVLEDIEQTRVMLRRKSGNVSIVMDDINPSIDSVLRGLKLLTDLSIDIVLIQEPYAISGPSPTLANVPPRYAAFHALSSDHAYGATIFLRQTIADSGRVKLMHRAIHSECIEVSSRFGTHRFMSLYLRPSLVNFCDSLNELFTELASPCSIFGIDANAKSLLWNSNRTDPKGVDLESLVLMHKLNFINVNKQHLEFIPGGTSFVDVTLAGDF
ncbi:hypothetical protein DAPPUDRAFT_323906 [Daphnia pulex]|uniref:Endonuclease/exonuclease/phosphatase domain-containing protein n=1 Tax=Daphnia pulex TaxID=6669 RepID=E9H052_DAPPU|nr:hypothetical protein DAPPUDRAFT_323906 [Daphnia pulex]|eukprot:EFX74931.1 hypothetical protein DAPPUDRAFT_323906 [Daphnia pulex]